ncbi:MAG: hypothetical protein JEZ03_03710 [Bacteroidales bacterium]|nr:hypothetical protein [Bacteroidales bacterium]
MFIWAANGPFAIAGSCRLGFVTAVRGLRASAATSRQKPKPTFLPAAAAVPAASTLVD